MKLCRIRNSNGVRPAAVDQKGALRDLNGQISDIDPDVTAPNSLARLQEIDPTDLPTITGDYDAILSDVRRIFCIGLNYSDHAKEINLPIPEPPILFMKTCPASGTNDPITIPNGSQKTDWEVELGIVIGSEAQHVTEALALNHVAGYCLANDVSERSFRTNGAANGPRGIPATPSRPWGHGWSTGTKFAIRRT